MSRTYRLRHEYSRIAQRFGDGRYSIHMDIIESDIAGRIVHGIYGYPCNAAGELLHTLNRSWCGTELDLVSHTNRCLPMVIEAWSMRCDWLQKIGGHQMFAIAPVVFHEHIGRNVSDKYDRYSLYTRRRLARRGERRNVHIQLSRLLVSGDFGGYDA
jgi:hypothetical protein